MKILKKIVVYIICLGIVFVYGLAVGHFKIFPYPQLAVLKHYLENSTEPADTPAEIAAADSVEVVETLLQRLLIKKIRIPAFSYGGGGLTSSGRILYIVTNKGSLQILDLDDYAVVENDITDVPMSVSDLIESGHPYKNEFRMHWFRVNGVFSEQASPDVHTLFVSHNAYDAARDCITQNVSRTDVRVSAGAVKQDGGWETIFTAFPCVDPEPDNILAATAYPGHISGGVIADFDESRLLVAVGDFNRHGMNGIDEWAADRSNPYGKFVLLDKRSGEWSIYTTGNRNGSGVYIDRNSTVWSVENGPKAGDELNILEEGENYGWPRVSYGIWYDPKFQLPGGRKYGAHPEYKKPILAWIPSVAPRGLIRLEGENFAGWAGDLLMGTMKDQSLHRLRLDENNRVVYDERIHLGHRVRDLIALPDGRLALVTDDGFLVVIDDGGPAYTEMDSDARSRMSALAGIGRNVADADAPAIEVAESLGQSVFQRNCSTCHNLRSGNQIGPHLHKLLNREIGAVEDYNYSRTLKAEMRSWSPELLRSFLINADDQFAGSTMQRVNLSTADIDSLIEFFENESVN